MRSDPAVRDVAILRIRRRLHVVACCGLVVLAGGALALPLAAYLHTTGSSAEAAVERELNPRSSHWRAVRRGVSGYTAVRGQERDVLIDNGGQNWRRLRNGLVAGLAPWWLGGVLLAIGTFFVVRGPVRLEHPPSGDTVERWSLGERLLHWYTTILFVLLAITGLSLLVGRAVLVPLLGLRGFATYAEVAKDAHNYLGPLFSVGVLLMVLLWFKHNLPNKVDWQWFKQGGGFLKNRPHPSAGRINGGEKAWFWGIMTVGTAVIVTGFILDFPNFGQTRPTMQIAHLLHTVLAVIWLSFAFGHIYIGTIGTEGALQAMTRGRVSVEWAKQHHDLWYAELAGQPDHRRPGPLRPRDKAST